MDSIRKHCPPILNSINLPKKEMQKQVENYLFTSGHFDQYPDELVKLKNTQERWKSRFTSALHALKKQGVIEPSNSGAKNWQGGNYRITKQSPGVVDGADTRGRPWGYRATAETLVGTLVRDSSSTRVSCIRAWWLAEGQDAPNGGPFYPNTVLIIVADKN